MRNWTTLVFSDDGNKFSIMAAEDLCDNFPFFIITPQVKLYIGYSTRRASVTGEYNPIHCANKS